MHVLDQLSDGFPADAVDPLIDITLQWRWELSASVVAGQAFPRAGVCGAHSQPLPAAHPGLGLLLQPDDMKARGYTARPLYPIL